MMNINNPLLYLILLFPIFVITSPIHYSRIILTHNGTIYRTIDLISDIHIVTANRPDSSNRNNENFLSDQEKLLFLPQERAFINSLYFLDRKESESKISLFFERSEDSTFSEVKSQLNDCLLSYYGKYFSNTPQAFQENVTFIAADHWRWDLTTVSLLTSMMCQAFEIPVNQLFNTVELDELKPFLTEEKTLFEQVKQHNSKEVADRILNQYHQMKSNFTNEFNKPKKKWDTQCIFPSRDKIKKTLKIIMEELKEPLKESLMEWELLLKLFASSSSHNIVYAGQYHCQQLQDFLLASLKGTLAISVGVDWIGYAQELEEKNYNNNGADYWSVSDNWIKFEMYKKQPLPQLNTKVWDWLKEPPLETWQNYQKKGPIVSIAKLGIIEKIQYLHDCSTEERANVWSRLSPYAQRCSIDVANSFNYLKSTLLHTGVIKKDSSFIEQLLKDGARIDATDSDGLTPLSYAVLNRQHIIAQQLLEHGANPEKKDNFQHSPLDFATSAQDTNMIQLLKRYVKIKFIN